MTDLFTSLRNVAHNMCNTLRADSLYNAPSPAPNLRKTAAILFQALSCIYFIARYAFHCQVAILIRHLTEVDTSREAEALAAWFLTAHSTTVSGDHVMRF